MFSHFLLAGGQLTPQKTMEIAVDNLQLSKVFRLTVLSDAIASLILLFKGGSTGKLFIYIVQRCMLWILRLVSPAAELKDILQHGA